MIVIIAVFYLLWKSLIPNQTSACPGSQHHVEGLADSSLSPLPHCHSTLEVWGTPIGFRVSASCRFLTSVNSFFLLCCGIRAIHIAWHGVMSTLAFAHLSIDFVCDPAVRKIHFRCVFCVRLAGTTADLHESALCRHYFSST